MIQSDYFLREIRKLALVLARIVGLKSEQEYGLALDEIDAAGKLYLGLQWEMIGLLSGDQLVEIFSSTDNRLSCYIAVRLLEAKANLLEAAGQMEQAVVVCEKARKLGSIVITGVHLPEGEPTMQEIDRTLAQQERRLKNCLMQGRNV